MVMVHKAISSKGVEMVNKREVVIELIQSPRNIDIDSSKLKK